jgi:hypothetical protein
MNGSGATPATLTARSVVLQCSATKYIGTGGYTAAQVAGFFGTSANNNNDSFISSLTNLFVNGPNEDGVTPFNATTLNAFFDLPSPNRIGAAWTGNTSWYTGWTCNSGYANFGTTSTNCTSLPTT